MSPEILTTLQRAALERREVRLDTADTVAFGLPVSVTGRTLSWLPRGASSRRNAGPIAVDLGTVRSVAIVEPHGRVLRLRGAA